jgi:hypothetical protein
MSSFQLSPTPENDDATWDAWRREVERLELHVRDLIFYNAVFRLSMHALRRWPRDRRGFIYHWILAMYARDTAVRIRRLVTTNASDPSLVRLLREIHARPRIVNAERFGRAYRVRNPTLEQAEFRRITNAPDDQLAPEFVQADLARLDALWVGSGLKDVTNWQIAHDAYHKQPRRTPAWQQVHDCIAEIERVFLRYRYLLCQLDSKSLLPANLEDVADDVARFWLDKPNDSGNALFNAFQQELTGQASGTE